LIARPALIAPGHVVSHIEEWAALPVWQCYRHSPALRQYAGRGVWGEE
jgi:hypothetical protein